MASLALRDVSKWFGSTPAERVDVLRAVDLDVADGEFLVLVGPSGCGKSTLLRIVAGLEAASSGDVLLDGRRVNDAEPRERDVAMVFQNYALYPHMSVRRNLAFPLRVARAGRFTIERKVDAVAELLGLTPLLSQKPGTLSGGQMQRVALGRAIVRDPRLFLFDEPLSNLDAKLRGEMRAEIARLHARLGITSLYVTHDQAEAMTMGSRICVLEAGVVQQIGAPLAVYQRPANRFVAGFIGSPGMNLVEGHVEGGAFVAAGLRAPGAPAADGTPLVFGIRPHELERAPTADADAFEATVEHAERLGSQTLLHVSAGGAPLLVVREGHEPLAQGERVRLRARAAHAHWFDAEAGARLEPVSAG